MNDYQKGMALASLVPPDVEKTFENNRECSDLKSNIEYARWVSTNRRNNVFGDVVGKKLAPISELGEEKFVPAPQSETSLDDNTHFEVWDGVIYSVETTKSGVNYTVKGEAKGKGKGNWKGKGSDKG